MNDPLAGRPHAVQPLFALMHLVVAVAALAVVLVLIYTGTRPNAELGAGFAVAGGLLAFPAVAFAGAAVACAGLRSKCPRRSMVLSLVLGWVELATALLLAWAAGVAVASYGEFAPWRSPVAIPALLVGTIGTAVVILTGRALRQSRES